MNGSSDPAELRTTRLLLRAWRREDREPFAALNADPAVMEHFPAPLSRSQSDLLVDRIKEQFSKEGWGLWAVEVTATGGFAGFVGLNRAAFAARFTPAVEVGWRLAHQYWHHGYATEAARAGLTYGFEALDLAEIVSFTSASNLRSQRVMERLGMQRNPEDDFTHPGIPAGNPLSRQVLYRLARSAWKASSAPSPG
ncbi:MAG TPA: GNAT family N-acetyltransferase [Candidatus Acidoferrales bacterium]|nr:GNAT family N-acetyltransferase [Candidatus Acidoferrales bacterium]